MRTFIALDVPEEIRDLAVSIRRSINTYEEGFRWVGRSNIHMTLKFLGEISKTQISRTESDLNSVCSETPAIQCHTGGISSFPDIENPKNVWISVIPDSDRLSDLKRRTDDGLSWIECQKGEHRFVPHITIARIRPDAARKKVSDTIKSVPDIAPVPFFLETVTLYKSELTPSGAIHTPIKSYSLKR